MKDELKRILNLVRKTGDRMIVTDTDGQNAYVVMDLDQYERLLENSSKISQNFESSPVLTEDEVQFPWPQQALEEDIRPVMPAPDIWSTMKPAGDESETWDLSKMSDDEVVDLEKQYQKYAQQSTAPQRGPSEIADQNPKISPKLDENEEDFGEEQFYLEPIE